MRVLQGKSVFGGYIYLKASVVRHDIPVFSKEKTSSDEEAERQLAFYREAKEKVLESLHSLMDGTREEEATILEAQCFMLEDPEFVTRIEGLISREHYNAPHAVEIAVGEQIEVLSQLPSQAYREHSSDLKDIASRLIGVLIEESCFTARLEEKSIIVADTILPSELLGLDAGKIAAVCLDGGGLASHVAILCRAMKIPCVIGLKDATSCVRDGSFVALDAFSARLFVEPDKKTVTFIEEGIRRLEEEDRELMEDAALPAITRDGVRIRLECNIEGREGVDDAIRNGSEGVGLFRTEFLLMGEDGSCSEDEQVEIYTRLASRFEKKGKFTIRTYDVGGDKITKDLGKDEDNPVLGWRAVRFCMSRKDIFRTQLRAILRASASCRLRIMFPMVSGCDELDGVLSFFEEVKEECRREGLAFDENIEVGTMIEVPSAAITSDILATKVDFFSVGTNDLTQYTIAVDRGNEKIGYLYQEYHIAMLRLLKFTRESAEKEKIGLSICGEMAGDPFYIPLLVGLGYHTLSMNPASILGARKRIRTMNYSDARELASKALNMTSCREVENLLEKFHAEPGNKE